MYQELGTSQQNFTGNIALVSENYLYLTPRLFERLDLLARVYAGRPIHVFDLDRERASMVPNKNWAFCSPMAGGIMSKDCEVVVDEKPVIDLANKIPIEEIENAERFEVRLGENVPLNCIYEWIVWHEIHHILNMDAMIGFDIKSNREPMIRSKITKTRVLQAMELQADRAAWKRFFPKSGPGRLDNNSLVREIEKYVDTLERIRNKYRKRIKKHKELVPAPVTPGQYMPYTHAKEGIPWAKEIQEFIQ